MPATLAASESSKKISEAAASLHTNRISVVNESSKNSSESVEILSGDTGCTTSPDSDAFSISSPSSTQGLLYKKINKIFI